MIKIERTDCPEFLRKSRSKTAYRDERVVKELWKMQNGKCCYCEADIPDEGHAKAVDHWRSQKLFKGKINDWKNLLLACPNCNGAKAEKFPITVMGKDGTKMVLFLKTPTGGDPAILNPSDGVTDPEEHFEFEMDLRLPEVGLRRAILRTDKDIRGETTIEVIRLDRDFYRRKHAKFICNMLNYFITIREAKENADEFAVERCLEKFRSWVSAKHQYCAVARAFARHYRLDSMFGLKIPKGWNCNGE